MVVHFSILILLQVLAMCHKCWTYEIYYCERDTDCIALCIVVCILYEELVTGPKVILIP